MRIPDPKANTTTEAYLAYKAGYLEESELKPVLYEPYLHFDGWLAYWAGLTSTYPSKGIGKNLIPVSSYDASENRTYTINGFILKAGTYTASFDLDSFSLGTNTNFEFRLALRDEENVGHNIVLIKPDSSTTTGHKTYTFYIGYNTSVKNWPSLYIPETPYSNGARVKVSNLQIEAGSSATEYEPYSPVPEMLTDEEALVAYLSGVTDTYPEEIKNPYDVRIVGYLKYLVSARWGRPEYPVNNEEFYLSTMKPPVVPSGDTPSSDIEMDDTAEAPFIDLKMYGDTSQQTYTGSNLLDLTNGTYSASGIDAVVENGIVTLNGTATANSFVSIPVNSNYSINDGEQFTLCLNNATANANCSLRVNSGGQYDVNGSQINNSKTSTLDASLPLLSTSITIRTQSGATYTNYVVKPQLSKGATVQPYEPYVGGTPAPNPDYPQNVNVVTGEQTVTVSRKNRLNPEVYQTGVNIYYPVVGFTFTNTQSSGISCSYTDTEISINTSIQHGGGAFMSSVLSAGTYHFSATVKAGSNNNARVSYSILDANRTVIDQGDYGTTQVGATRNYNWTINVPNNGVYIAFSFATSAVSGGEITVSNPQLEAGSTTTSYEPYQSQSYEINLGKNLFTFGYGSGKFQGITWTRNGDTAVGVGTATGNYTDTGTRIDLPAPLKAGQDYVFSIPAPVSFGCSLYLFDKNDQVISPSAKINAGETSVVFNKEVDIYKARITLSDYGGAGKELDIELRAQIELGSTATGYAPQFEPIELCKIGDYQDYIYRDEDGDWYIHRNVQHLSLSVSSMDSDSENYPGWTSPSITDILTNTLPDGNYPLAEKTSLLCNCLGSGGDMINKVRWNNSTSTAPRLYLSRTSSEYYKLSYSEWIEQYPNLVFEIYYGIVKNAPRTIITNPELISQLNALMEGGSYEGKTYIKVTATDPNLPGLLYVEAGKYD